MVSACWLAGRVWRPDVRGGVIARPPSMLGRGSRSASGSSVPVRVARVERGDEERRHELQQPEDAAPTLMLPKTSWLMKSRAQPDSRTYRKYQVRKIAVTGKTKLRKLAPELLELFGALDLGEGVGSRRW